MPYIPTKEDDRMTWGLLGLGFILGFILVAFVIAVIDGMIWLVGWKLVALGIVVLTLYWIIKRKS